LLAAVPLPDRRRIRSRRIECAPAATSRLDLGLLELTFMAAALAGALSLQLLERVPEAG